MAFPLPDHLPRRAAPQDISSRILGLIDAATFQTLNAELARSWLVDLDNNIASIKHRIHDTIHSDLPKFESQLAASRSVRERLQALKADVDVLHETVSHPQKAGLVSTVTQRLARHGALVQEATNASIYYKALLHLSQCQRQYADLEALAQAGRLPEAILSSRELNDLLRSAPTALERSKILADLRRKARAAEALVEEQLSDAYSRSVIISRQELLICPFVQVRNSETIISLSSTLSALSDESLNNHLSILKRDLTTQFFDHVLKEPCSIAVYTSISKQAKLTCATSPSSNEQLSSRLENLTTILDFLHEHLFPHLPSSRWSSFSGALRNVLSNGILDNLLRPSLPLAFEGLLPYLSIVQQAVEFEEKYIVGVLGGDVNDRTIQLWTEKLSSHYERQRRVQILNLSRTIILASDSIEVDFLEDIDLLSETTQPSDLPMPEVSLKDEGEDSSLSAGYNEDAWGFGDDEKSGSGGSATVDEDSWGFDEDTAESETASNQHTVAENEHQPKVEDVAQDPGDTWGWNEDNDIPIEDSGDDSAWDDPWADAPSSEQSEELFAVEDAQASTPSVSQPKVASRLERLAAKHRKPTSTDPQPQSPLKHSTMSSQSMAKSREIAPPHARTNTTERPENRASHPKTMNLAKESYRVSGRMKELLRLVEDVISEGKHLSRSKVLPSTSGSSLGTIILQSAPSALDLFQALYPVKYARDLESADSAMAFSNDCLYMSRQAERLLGGPAQDTMVLKDKLEECKSHLKVLSESWHYDTIERQKQNVDKILVDGAQGFVDSADQARYDECEAALMRVLKEIRYLASKLKGLLPKSKYYSAIGSVTEATLSRILDDILALGDIPEVESHRLSELCRILNALEGLFVEDHNHPSFVLAYVPSWLKFSYLSELLEASMADITYLFEVNALVDFSADELVRLVRALFADTNLRTTTINKILVGHPQ